MINCNEHTFTGQVRWYKERAINPLFCLVNTKIELPRFEFTLNGSNIFVNGPLLWLSIKTNPSRQHEHDKVIKACSNSAYVFINNAEITHYMATPKDQNGNHIPGAPQEMRFSISVANKNIQFSDKPFPVINMSKVIGKIHSVNSPWITLEVSKRIAKSSEYKSEYLNVITDDSQIQPSSIGSNVCVLGKVCGKDPKSNERLYVASDKIMPFMF